MINGFTIVLAIGIFSLITTAVVHVHATLYDSIRMTSEAIRARVADSEVTLEAIKRVRTETAQRKFFCSTTGFDRDGRLVPTRTACARNFAPAPTLASPLVLSRFPWRPAPDYARLFPPRAECIAVGGSGRMESPQGERMWPVRASRTCTLSTATARVTIPTNVVLDSVELNARVSEFGAFGFIRVGELRAIQSGVIVAAGDIDVRSVQVSVGSKLTLVSATGAVRVQTYSGSGAVAVVSYGEPALPATMTLVPPALPWIDREVLGFE